MANEFKLDFENLGPLRRGSLKLRDFNLICGVNNSGKTYLAYLLFGILEMCCACCLKSLGFVSASIAMEINLKKETQEWKKFGSVIMNQETVINFFEEIIEDIEDNIENYVDDLIGNLKNGLKGAEFGGAAFFANIFNCRAQSFPDISYDPASDIQAMFNLMKENLADLLKDENNIPKIPGIAFKWTDEQFIIEACKTSSNGYRNISADKLLSLYFLEFFKKTWPRPYLFSAERSSIGMFVKELDSSRNTLVDSLQRLDNIKTSNKTLEGLLSENSSRFSEPVALNIKRIRNIPDRLDKNKMGILWRDYGEELQRRFDELNDGFTYSWDKESQQFYYSIGKDGKTVSIPLHAGSSMSRELFDLYYYLMFDSAPGDIVIIDEPEAHLHPQKQMLLTRLLAFLSNRGIRILVTTHSDFIVREANNLIIANELKTNKFEISKQEWLEKHNVLCCETTASEGKEPNTFDLEERTVHSYGVGIKVIDKAIDEQASTAAELCDELRENGHNV